MYHTIEFPADLWVDLEVSPKQPLERVLVRRGTQVRAQIRPHIVETLTGPTEAADLYFEDGTTARDIAFRRFAFTD